MSGPTSPSSPQPASTGPSSTSVSSTSSGPARSWSWLVPAGTFLAGCALGAIVVGVGDAGGGDDAAPPPAAAVAEPDAGPDDVAGEASAQEEDAEAGLTVRVPDSCVQTAEDATTLVEHVDRLVAAVADLEPERLRQTIDEVQQVRDDVRPVAEQCRADAEQAQGAEAAAETDGAAVDDPATPAS